MYTLKTPLLYRKIEICRGIPNFLIFNPKHTLCVLVRTASNRLDEAVLTTQGAKSLYLAKKRLEVTSPAIVVLNVFLDSSDIPKEGPSGLLWKIFWRDALIRRYLDVLFVIQMKCSTQLYYEQSYL